VREDHSKAAPGVKDKSITVAHLEACVLEFEGKAYQGTYSYACDEW